MSCYAYVMTWVGVMPNASLRLGFLYMTLIITWVFLRKIFVVGIFGVLISGLLQSYPVNRISSPRLRCNVLFEEVRIS